MPELFLEFSMLKIIIQKLSAWREKEQFACENIKLLEVSRELPACGDQSVPLDRQCRFNANFYRRVFLAIDFWDSV